MKKILVPLAFSKYSGEILGFAAQLAGPLGARMLIANVVNERDLEAVERVASHGYKVDVDRYIATIQKERGQLLEKLIDQCAIAEEDYDYIFLAGDPSEELLKLVVKENIDMVVMGTKAKDLRYIFAGSVAERMFRKCPVPVVSYRGEDIACELAEKIKKNMS